MPGEFEKQEKVWMIWPQRPNNWRDGAKPAQHAYSMVAQAIANHPFYRQSPDAYRTLCQMTDAKGRHLKVHKICCTKEPVLRGNFCIDKVPGNIERTDGELAILPEKFSLMK